MNLIDFIHILRNIYILLLTLEGNGTYYVTYYGNGTYYVI
jgi:hypothetical protein